RGLRRLRGLEHRARLRDRLRRGRGRDPVDRADRRPSGLPHVGHAGGPQCRGRARAHRVPYGGTPRAGCRGRVVTTRRGPFVVGERVQLTSIRGRMNTVTLAEDGAFHSHRGYVDHADIIGKPDGTVVLANNGEEYLALRPLLKDFALSMPRGAAIVYPKDAAQILALADVFPGARVIEAGVGSGALTMWLLRAIGADGSLLSVERREEFATIAQANVETFTGERPANWTVTLGDFAEVVPAATEPGSVDRIVLDMLAPWDCIEAAADALAPGGVLCCYVATVTQLSRVTEAIRATDGFTDPEASETLVRTWHVEGLAVRPDHRMNAHTGFLLTARRLAPGAVPLEKLRRASKVSYSDEDVEAWTPGALGERVMSPKRARKAVRQAVAAADAQRPDAADSQGSGPVE
ncbi:MAG: tRNA (adenine-N1)-methyltransferase, partial [Microbacteriaceae bacterium]|nr:tRNA (adenine-N1)-methyltransferase [Microbacteriaceae bacterium]